MPVNLRLTGRSKPYESTSHAHAEKLFCEEHRASDATTFALTMDAWPCIEGARGKPGCHRLLQILSIGRTITLVVSGDHAGYAVNHNLAAGSTGTIVYANGSITYEPANLNPPAMPKVTIKPTKAAVSKQKATAKGKAKGKGRWK
ncbi:hypothetical protein GCM10007863_38180 [Dyella mobilis]|nr:hypothetical protein GCM10007863_38180 [Dyella mobilis]